MAPVLHLCKAISMHTNWQAFIPSKNGEFDDTPLSCLTRHFPLDGLGAVRYEPDTTYLDLGCQTAKYCRAKGRYTGQMASENVSRLYDLVVCLQHTGHSYIQQQHGQHRQHRGYSDKQQRLAVPLPAGRDWRYGTLRKSTRSCSAAD